MTTEFATLLTAVGRVEGKLDTLNSSVGRAHSRLDEQERRLNALEVNQGKIIMLGGLGAFIVPIVANFILKIYF